MNRATNHQALMALIEAIGHVQDEATQIKLRRAAYLHAIVEAVLSETVGCLPQTTAIYS